MADRISELRTAKTFLAEEYPAAYTPERVIELLNLKQKGATLARKFRDAVRTGELAVSYYRNENNEEIAQYAYNPEYHQTEKQIAHADFLRDQARDEGMLSATSPEVQAAAQIHKEMM
jgi:hypothetical protein